MNPLEINYRLNLSGISQADLARELGCSKAAVSQAVSGRYKSRRIQSRIAEILGEPVEALWPPVTGDEPAASMVTLPQAAGGAQ